MMLSLVWDQRVQAFNCVISIFGFLCRFFCCSFPLSLFAAFAVAVFFPVRSFIFDILLNETFAAREKSWCYTRTHNPSVLTLLISLFSNFHWMETYPYCSQLLFYYCPCQFLWAKSSGTPNRCEIVCSCVFWFILLCSRDAISLSLVFCFGGQFFFVLDLDLDLSK